LVVEIAFSDLQASTRYPGGLALRLARVKRYRDDKRLEDADNMDSVRRIYDAQFSNSLLPQP
jgi:DNA ligase-1